MSYLMGIDLGTSSLKTLIMDESGHVKSISARSYQFDSPHNGYAEQDPGQWWQACCETTAEALRTAGILSHEIRGISFSGQMHGAVMLDSSYLPVRPAILHCDARSSRQVKKIKAQLGIEMIREYFMNPVYTGFLLPSLIWVREEEPYNYEKIRYVMLPKDYIRFRMTGTISSDYSDASATLAFDIKRGCWSGKILEILNIPVDYFPECCGTADIAGEVTEQAAKETGLWAGTCVIAGGGDQVMQAIGNGSIQPGSATVNVGSSGQVCFQSACPVANPALNTNTFCGYSRDRWITMGAIMSAGLSLKWINGVLRQTDYRLVNKEADSVPPGSGGLLFLPYLTGERTPHINPNLTGMFVGLSLNTGRAEMTRAVMEGVAFALRECMEICRGLGLQADRVIASGGGARSIPWLQIQSDIYGLPLKVADTEEQACLGAAIAAGTGAGIYQNIEEGCRQVVRYRDLTVTPSERNHGVYDEYYRLFKEVYRESRNTIEQVTLLGRNPN
ncbi:xylulokinase [Diplocloster modestus]|uniref:Xylulose kinase n=1 Tax=Diplocloster modestus TaxID=2850322 RepID=A0ABS6K781_9FIRM|nr:xylulokinase [Diplocloster modestus]MBU9726352.1 xylulokinase [Diplocloster modestus]